MGAADTGGAGTRAARFLAIGSHDLEPTLLRLRRDLPDLVAYWSLGRRGAFELDALFAEAPGAGGRGPVFETRGRLWETGRRSVSPVLLQVCGTSDRESELSLSPAGAVLPDHWRDRPDAYAALARAALDELAEELLWQASRLRAENAPA